MLETFRLASYVRNLQATLTVAVICQVILLGIDQQEKGMEWPFVIMGGW